MELLSAVEPRVVNWKLVTKGEEGLFSFLFYLPIEINKYYIIIEEEKKLNATYLISVGRKLGCSIFLLPEDIIEVSDLYLNS